MGYSTVATALSSKVIVIVVAMIMTASSATMESAADEAMAMAMMSMSSSTIGGENGNKPTTTIPRRRMLFSSSTSPRAFEGDDMARSIFYFYVFLLLFVACLCSFHLMWKSPEETAIHVVVNDISVWEQVDYDEEDDDDDVVVVDTTSSSNSGGNNLPSIEIEVRSGRDDRFRTRSTTIYQLGRQQQRIDVQSAIDRTAQLRKKLQLLVYLRQNHVEMVRNVM